MSSSSTSVAPSSARREQFRDPSSRHGAAGGSVHFHDGEPEVLPKLNPFAKEFVPIPAAASESFIHVIQENTGTNSSRSGQKGSSNVNIKAAGKTAARNGNGPSKPWQPSGATPPGGKRYQRAGNHLLNFQYDPIVRPPPRSHQPPPSRRQRRAQPYNKELFLQANFRFLVSDLGDYALNASDPDKMLQWEDVSAVNVTAPVPVQCPICLDTPPLCPQITSCGHIFCFPCILHYMMLDRGDPWKKCPLCFAMISVKEMRTVIVSAVQQYRAGDVVKFNLLTRAKNSITPFEKSRGSLGALAYSEDGQFHLYSKFTLTSEAEHVTDRAVAELTSRATENPHGGEDLDVLPYIYEAIDQLQQRKAAWTEHRTLDFLSSSPPVRQRIASQPKAAFQNNSPEDSSLVQSFNSSLDGAAASDPPPVVDVNVAKDALSKRQPGGSKVTDVAAQTEAAMAKLKEEAGWVYESAFADDAFASELNKVIDAPSAAPELDEYVAVEKEGEPSDWEELVMGSPDLAKDQSTDKLIPKDQVKRGDQDDSETYTFYQSADGQFLILHPLNMKALLQHYGDYKSLPSSIEARIVELEPVTQTEGTRKRYRYLSHLPLTANFQLCEVDLHEMLPAEAFAPFAEEIRTRQQRRRRLIQQEKMEKAKEERLAASIASSQPRAPSPADFAAYMSSLQMEDPEFELELDAASTTPSPPTDSRSSFSNVAKMGFASGYDAPQLPEPQLPSSASKQQTPNVMPPPSGQCSSSSSSLSFADIIQAQASAKGASSEDGSAGGGKSGRKNKKGSMVLLSTAGGRRY